MTDEEQGGSGSGFGWFLVGLGIGAAIGVLYAPQAGTETRESLAESARERAEYLKQKSGMPPPRSTLMSTPARISSANT